MYRFITAQSAHNISITHRFKQSKSQPHFAKDNLESCVSLKRCVPSTSRSEMSNQSFGFPGPQ